jgi:AraC-like DNA-binding protein
VPVTSRPELLRPACTDREVVDRADSYLRANPHVAIRVSHLSRVLGVSERTLRNAFYRVRGMAPHRSMLATRLESVRRALCTTDDRSITVTVAAVDHGFSELGRFAARYRDAFGECPSATLRRQRTSRTAHP